MSEDPNNIIHNRKHGVLTGIDDIHSAKYYTNSLNFKDTVAILSNKHFIYESALKDVNGDESLLLAYFENINKKIMKFKNEKKLWDREDLMKGLSKSTNTKGNFVCILGGQSTGKSFVLHKFQENAKNKVIIVDLRDDTNLVRCLTTAIGETSKSNMYYKIFETLGLQLLNLSVKSRANVDIDFKGIWEKIGKVASDETLSQILNQLADRLIESGSHLTIIIDEANRALTIND